MKKNTPIKSIRQHCLECSCQQKGEVLNCHLEDCPLHPYRLGKNPNRKRKAVIQESGELALGLE